MKVRTELGWKLVGFLGRFLLSFIAWTSRIKVVGQEAVVRLRQQRRPIIYLTWHGRIFLCPYFFRRQGMMPLVSPSEDGEIVARIIEGWGYKTIRGSSSHSVVAAWKEMVRELRQGGQVIIIPDGPRGPNRVFKPGALRLAQETGAWLVPFSFSSSRGRWLRSWDNFLLALPFARVVALYGSPRQVPAELSAEELEDYRRSMEAALSELDAEADRLVRIKQPCLRHGENN